VGVQPQAIEVTATGAEDHSRNNSAKKINERLVYVYVGAEKIKPVDNTVIDEYTQKVILFGYITVSTGKSSEKKNQILFNLNLNSDIRVRFLARADLADHHSNYRHTSRRSPVHMAVQEASRLQSTRHWRLVFDLPLSNCSSHRGQLFPNRVHFQLVQNSPRKQYRVQALFCHRIRGIYLLDLFNRL
jgi:hypothetical protein